MFEILKKFHARDVHDAFGDSGLGLTGRIAEMAQAGVPWEVIFALVLQMIQAWLNSRKPA